MSAGALLAAASAVSYGCLAVLVKLAYDEGWNVPSLLVARFGIAALCLLPLALRAGGSWRGFGGALLVGAVGFAGTTALYFPSLRHLDAAVASFLLYLSPVLVALLSRAFLGERLGRRGLAALGLAVAGLAVMASGALTGEMSPLGALLAAGSAAAFALTVLGSRHLTGSLPWARASFGVCVGAAGTYLAFSLATGMLEAPLGTAALVDALLIGTLATAVALSLFMAALPRIGASRTALISTLEPVSTLVIAFLVVGEVPGALGVAGGALILAGAALVATQAQPAEP